MVTQQRQRAGRRGISMAAYFAGVASLFAGLAGLLALKFGLEESFGLALTAAGIGYAMAIGAHIADKKPVN